MFKKIVSSREMYFSKSLILRSGFKICNYKLVYETYGALNINKSNAILIFHALNASHHVMGIYKKKINNIGWWNNMVGPEKSVNTNIFFVLSINNLGSCYGSTSPMHVDLCNRYLYAKNFPILTIEDWINSQILLINKLKIRRFAFVIGGSLGGMQVLSLSVMFPRRLLNCVVVASCLKLSSQNIAFNKVSRQAIVLDSNFNNGNFYFSCLLPNIGLSIARMIGHITYISEVDMSNKFGRNLQYENYFFNNNDVDFKVESYLQYQGEKFSKYFDANTYLLITKLLNYFNLFKIIKDNFYNIILNIKLKFLIISFNTDWRFSFRDSYEIIKILINIKYNIYYAEVCSFNGHDSFLLKNFYYMKLLREYVNINFIKNI